METIAILALVAFLIAVFWFTKRDKDAVAPVPGTGPATPFKGGRELSDGNQVK